MIQIEYLSAKVTSKERAGMKLLRIWAIVSSPPQITLTSEIAEKNEVAELSLLNLTSAILSFEKAPERLTASLYLARLMNPILSDFEREQ